MKFGKSSKLTMKLPCSPQSAEGIAVADKAGNGLLKLEVDVLRTLRATE